LWRTESKDFLVEVYKRNVCMTNGGINEASSMEYGGEIAWGLSILASPMYYGLIE